MNEKRIIVGIVACFLGIIVPVCHHMVLFATIAQRPTNNVIRDMQLVFEYLPWIDWLYLGLMFITGAILIISGMRANLTLQRAEAIPRGFEVVGVPEGGPGR